MHYTVTAVIFMYINLADSCRLHAHLQSGSQLFNQTCVSWGTLCAEVVCDLNTMIHV